LDFLMGYESYQRSRVFAYKVVNVFNFHLQIFHCFIDPSSHRYFQGHSP
jgi:hypothetical protein